MFCGCLLIRYLCEAKNAGDQSGAGMENSYLKQYNRSRLRASQLAQLEMLKVIDEICHRHGLTYWLDAGTLLGAVRHGGFIPWDDDLDIAMPAEDLARFTEIAPRELPSHLFIQNKQTDPGYRFEHTKVVNCNSFYVQFDDDFESPYQKGLFIDIFPYIPYPALPVRFRKKFLRGMCVAYSVLHGKHYYSWENTAKLFWFGMKHLLFRGLWRILPRTERYFSCLPSNNWHGMVQERTDILPVGRIRFENQEFDAPHDPDAYLKKLYKNYMQLPPEDKRDIHSVFIIPQLSKES